MSSAHAQVVIARAGFPAEAPIAGPPSQEKEEDKQEKKDKQYIRSTDSPALVAALSHASSREERKNTPMVLNKLTAVRTPASPLAETPPKVSPHSFPPLWIRVHLANNNSALILFEGRGVDCSHTCAKEVQRR